MKMNDKGSVLCITVALVLVFLLLGLASINNAGMQNVDAEKRQASVEAFWLADGGIEQAVSVLPGTTYYNSSQLGDYIYSNSSLGRGVYKFYSAPQDCDPDTAGIQPCPGNQHNIKAWGEVLGQIREIEAEAGEYNIDGAINSHGPIADDCEPKGSAEINGNCNENIAFNFDDVFGLPYQDVVNNRDNYYEDPCNNCVPAPADRSDGNQVNDTGLWGITYVYFTPADNSPSLNINNTEDLQHVDASGNLIPSLLIIDTTDASKVATIRIEGGTGFRGIIWIKGEADIQGGTINGGSIFVDCEVCENVNVGGNSDISFDEDAVQEVVDYVWGPYGGPPTTLRFSSWKECPNSGCSF